MDEYDVVIIGCGPAGLTSAIFCGRASFKTAVIGIPEKSQMNLAAHIENYFGFPEGIDGHILLKKGMIQAKRFGTEIIKDEVVAATPVEQEGKKYFIIKTGKGVNLKSRAMIIATGVPIRLSGIKNEEKFTNKGVHYCLSCDGPMYKNKRIVIIGSGNHAAEEAVEALSYTKYVTMISNSAKFDYDERFQKEIDKWQIQTIVGKVKEFCGEKFFEYLLMEDGSKQYFGGAFMGCGIAGALDFAANLGLEIKENILVVDENNMTSMDGVFAAGNCAGKCRQIAKNVGDGCNAAMNAIKHMRAKELYFDYGNKNLEVPPGTPKKAEPVQPILPAPKLEVPVRKMRIGWFTFSCCEDSTVVFTELLNDHYDAWKNIIDIRYARVLKKNNDMTDLDVAFVEGAISNDKAEEELKKIRQNCKKLVAIGACATTGMPSGQRNVFDETRQKEIEPMIRAFDYNKHVKSLKEIVQVDDSVPGCPMTESGFLAVVNKYAKEFGVSA